MKLFSIYDEQLSVFAPPFAARAVPEAIRVVKSSFRGPEAANSAVGMAPQEFSLYSIGEYDESTGRVNVEVLRVCGVAEILVRENGHE